MTSQILTPHAKEYSLPETERLALLPPEIKGGKLRSLYQLRNLKNSLRKLKNNV